jgi:N-acetylglucosamine malate deacetylase 1
MAERKTLLVALSHPDDEVGCAGTMAAHAAAGHRVVVLFLTRGEMTEALGSSDASEVARLRMEHGREAARLVGVDEVSYLDLPDTRVEVSADANWRVAAELARIRPDAVITWGDAWRRGPRHPDHQATGQIVRGAITLARITRVVHPMSPHREPVPVFTIREAHSTLPEAVVDVTAQLDRLHALADHYRERVGWPPRPWLEERLAVAGRPWGLDAAESFDAWETPPGIVSSLFTPPSGP